MEGPIISSFGNSCPNCKPTSLSPPLPSFQYTLDQIPIDRLTASDIKQQAGGIAAVVVLAIVLLIVVSHKPRRRLTGVPVRVVRKLTRDMTVRNRPSIRSGSSVRRAGYRTTSATMSWEA